MNEGPMQGVAAIEAAFAAAHDEGRAALVAYVTAGYPSPADTPGLVWALVEGGADVIELGVPFSDPVADGPVIQAAAQVALQRGMTPSACVEMVRGLREAGLSRPVLLMGYYNPILTCGADAYARECASAGVDGLIVPDLPPEEAGELKEACRREGLALVFLVAPTTGEERLARIAAQTTGFLYVVSRLGTTGASGRSAEEAIGRLGAIRRVARTPMAVGFGVSRPEQAAALAPHVDGVVVGSALVERAPRGADGVRRLARSLTEALARNGRAVPGGA